MEKNIDSKQDWTAQALADVAGVDSSRIRQLLIAGKELCGDKFAKVWRIPYTEGLRWLESRGKV